MRTQEPTSSTSRQKNKPSRHNLKIILMIILFLIYMAGFGNLDVFARENLKERNLIVLSQDNSDKILELENYIESNNGEVSHQFENKALIAEIDNNALKNIKNKVKGVYKNQVSNEEINEYGSGYKIIFDIWNQSFNANVKSGSEFEPIIDDALVPGDKLAEENFMGGESDMLGNAPYGAASYDTAEYMAGKVSLAIILPESSGSLDASTENWDSGREAQVLSEIQKGMNWWYERSKGRGFNLSFKYHFYTGRTDNRAKTKYEPIRRSAYTGSAEQGLWIEEIMNKFGYTGSDYFAANRSFTNQIRENDDSDWAFTIFVADSKNDADGRFSDSKFAYAYYGGPFMVMTYDNNNYGINNMESIAAHETGHIFYALDQYYSAKKDCREKAGYLAFENQNSQYNKNGGGCGSNVASIMRGGTSPYTQGALDKYAASQIGWRDDNNNGIIDILDVPPSASVTSIRENSNNTHAINGRASVNAAKNINPYTDSVHSYHNQPNNNITLNNITKVQYKVDNGSWQNVSSGDGGFGEPEEDFLFTTPKLSKGLHQVYTKAQDNVGNWSDISSKNIAADAPDIIAGAGPTGGPHVRVFDANGNVNHSFFVYEEHIRSGVSVASGDVDGDGVEEIVTGPGNNAGPHIRIFKKDGTLKYPGFFAYDERFRGGVNIALGDLDGDGTDEIIAGAGVGGGPHIRVFDALGNQKITAGFFAYAPNFRGGVNIAAGDIDNDGKDEIIAGAGKGGGPQVRAFEGDGTLKPNQFFAFHPDFRGGIDVASGDTDGDGRAEIIVSQLSEGEAWVKVYQYDDNKTILGNFNAYGQGVEFGAHVGVGDIDLNGKDEIITGAGFGGGPHVRTFKYNGELLNPGFFAYGELFRGGVFVNAIK